MNGFQNQTASPSPVALDPNKHVKYNLGMVLGVDDFNQEFAYLSNRDQWLARDLIGYGTVCGLEVTIETDSRGPRVVVSPGVALNPRGQLIRVTPAQCAYLNDWLVAHRDEVNRATGSLINPWVTLYVVLCYRECPTDAVPIPGEPCRDETETTASSRLKDDFKLELTFQPPDQTEEEALRDFVQWLSQIEVAAGATSVSLDQFVTIIHDAAHLLASPPGSPPDFMVGSPPSTLRINAADMCEYLRAAFRVWVTDLRGYWRGKSCDGSPPLEDCVLLAKLTVPLVNGQAGSMSNDNLNEERRPYLIHLRLLQEWLVCGRGIPTPSDAVVTETAFGQAAAAGTSASYSRADHTHGTPTLPPIPQPDDTVVAETAFGQAADAGTSASYSRADHTHGTPTLPPIPQPDDTVIAETAFGQAAAAGTSASYSRADHTHGTPPALTGDVTVNPSSGQAVVGGLSSIPLDLSNLNDGNTLIFNRQQNRWLPGTAGGPATGNFVERPAGLPRYLIVAAGIVRGNGTSRFPIYNDLTAAVTGSGQWTLKFNGYSNPTSGFTYIVKALPVFNDQFRLPMVSFVGFSGDGIILYLSEAGQPITGDNLTNMELVIEVSQYFSISRPDLRPLIDLNTATGDELVRLPGIGPALAGRIISARDRSGGFSTPRDLLDVPGIGESLLNNIQPLVTINPSQ